MNAPAQNGATVSAVALALIFGIVAVIVLPLVIGKTNLGHEKIVVTKFQERVVELWP